MNLHQLRTQLSQTRYTLVMVGVMLLMVYIGYQLALFNQQRQQQSLAQLQVTMTNLTNENEALTSANNTLRAQLEIAELTKENLDQEIQQGLTRETQLKEQLSFYQKVIAPEESEDGFTIDSIQIAPSATANRLQLSLVLVQQLRLKGVIYGTLKIQLLGNIAGQAITLDLQELVSDGDPFAFRFKYFQIIDTYFSVPEEFVPEALQIEAGIRQYQRYKGTYRQSFKITVDDEGAWLVNTLIQ
ncbi:DUF6776 family protein [Alteromonas flava]|uniref:DUF6776 family protein n=1 Tax=Alteromonas flava TaxID=2048003 RepID=UPI000C28E287|nr:DUF6776 family protein [Alteromonas flava]